MQSESDLGLPLLKNLKENLRKSDRLWGRQSSTSRALRKLIQQRKQKKESCCEQTE